MEFILQWIVEIRCCLYFTVGLVNQGVQAIARLKYSLRTRVGKFLAHERVVHVIRCDLCC